MSRALDGGEKHILVAIVVKIGNYGGATGTDGIHSGDPGDVHEFLAIAIHEQSVAFVTAEGEPLFENQTVLIVAQSAGFFLGVILRHDLTPELASSVAHGLAGDEAVGGVKIAPAVVVKIQE